MITTERQPISRRQIRLDMESNFKRHAEREARIAAIAARQNMRVIATGISRVAMAEDESIEGTRGQNAGKSEPFTIYLYQIDDGYLARSAWTPGICIAKVHRQDLLDASEFEAIGKSLVA